MAEWGLWQSGGYGRGMDYSRVGTISGIRLWYDGDYGGVVNYGSRELW